MTDKGKSKTKLRNDIVDEVIDLRLNKGMSRTSIYDYLTKEKGYSRTRANLYIASAAKEFEARAVVNFGEDLKEDIERFEKLFEKAIKADQNREARECLKEISKLKGHYVERVNVSGSIDTKVTVIKLIAPPDEDKSDI